MIALDFDLRAKDLVSSVTGVWEASAPKIRALERRWRDADGAPVITQEGRYTTRAWTEWTLGFRYGSALLQHEATGETEFLEIGRRGTLEQMTNLLTHSGVHDHGFQIVSTHGNCWRMLSEGTCRESSAERSLHELALRVSGAVQARRWTALGADRGFVHSFNGPHSLFADTLRSMRSLVLAHELGHRLLEERDRAVCLLERAYAHVAATAEFAVFYGEGRDLYDERGRVAHESVFDIVDGSYRCPATQQGYSPFSTWTRAQAWILLGAAELLEYLRAPSTRCARESATDAGAAARRANAAEACERMARATADHYLQHTPTCGVPYWDTGARGLRELGDWGARAAEPENAWEPVDSSAAAIAAQGLLRLATVLGGNSKDASEARRYRAAGLTVFATLSAPRYLDDDPQREGLLLHSVYHRPGGWDFAPLRPTENATALAVPFGESSMWGDYHLRELALCVGRLARDEPLPRFFGPER